MNTASIKEITSGNWARKTFPRRLQTVSMIAYTAPSVRMALSTERLPAVPIDEIHQHIADAQTEPANADRHRLGGEIPLAFVAFGFGTVHGWASERGDRERRRPTSIIEPADRSWGVGGWVPLT